MDLAISVPALTEDLAAEVVVARADERVPKPARVHLHETL